MVDYPVYRLIPSHFPPIQIFEHLLDPEDLEAAYALESLTNDRLREEAGDISLVLPEDRIVGEGTSVIMAAFTHVGHESRFTHGGYGVYYGGLSMDTAIAESKHNRVRLLSATDEEPCEITMRCYRCDVIEELEDVRPLKELHDPNDWAASQTYAKTRREADSWGLLYSSVRHEGGECVAIFKPKALKPPTIQAAHYRYIWDGEAITSVYAIGQVYS